MGTKMRGWIIIVIAFLAVWLSPVPEGLTLVAWHLFAVFLATIVGFIVHPIPMGAIAFLSISVAALTRVVTTNEIFGAFGNTTIWLIASAFFFAKGFSKTGLGKRIAYVIIRMFGTSTLKLAYSISITDLIIGPAVPSNTARAGGVFFPIVRSLCESFDSKPGATAKRFGTFMMTSVFQTDIIVSAMFLTSMAGNPLSAELARKTLGVDITWGGWIMATIVPGLVAIILVPLLVYALTKPEIKKTPQAHALATDELAKMGPMSYGEKVMFAVFILALVLWATGSITHIADTVVAILGIGILLVAGVLEWEDIITEKKAWDTFIWMGVIVGLAEQLNKSGFITWFGNRIAGHVDHLPWMAALIAVFLIYMYSHYGFASMTAHIAAMYAALGVVAVVAGVPPFVAAIALAVDANLCGCLTHYGAGPAPIFFGGGYVSQNKWWSVGFVISLLSTAIFLGIGLIWWKVLGLW